MTREQKASAMNKTTCDLNNAKDRMYKAVEILTKNGMTKDAETLMNMIYRLEAFQHKY